VPRDGASVYPNAEPEDDMLRDIAYCP